MIAIRNVRDPRLPQHELRHSVAYIAYLGASVGHIVTRELISGDARDGPSSLDVSS